MNDIDYRGIATDLNVASALLLPGMSWKQRVIAHIRSPTKDWLMLPSQWIKRSQSVFQSNETEKEKKEKGQREETSSLINSEFATTAAAAPSNIIRVDGLSSDDIENNVLHLRVRQDNTWSLNNNSDAGRELGRTSEFPLSRYARKYIFTFFFFFPFFFFLFFFFLVTTKSVNIFYYCQLLLPFLLAIFPSLFQEKLCHLLFRHPKMTNRILLSNIVVFFSIKQHLTLFKRITFFFFCIYFLFFIFFILCFVFIVYPKF